MRWNGLWALLPPIGEGADLAGFLPPPSEARVRSPLQRQAALASTFMVGLELACHEIAKLRQIHPFENVTILSINTLRVK